jgi:hypothetical protein
MRAFYSGKSTPISDMDAGMIADPAMPITARARMSIAALVANAPAAEASANTRRTDDDRAPAADPVAERTHGEHRACDQVVVAVADPQQLRGARLQVAPDRGQRDVHHREVDRDQQGRERERHQAEQGGLARVGVDAGEAVRDMAILLSSMRDHGRACRQVRCVTWGVVRLATGM